MQQQSLQRPIAEQSMLASQSAKHTEELRRQNTAIDKSSNLDVKADQDSAEGKAYNKQKKKRASANQSQETGQEPPAHPFKGHHFDIKL